MNNKSDIIPEYKSVMKELPNVSRKNLAACWGILRMYPFVSGSIYSIAVATTPLYKAWRIALDSTDTFQDTMTRSRSKFCYIPYPKYSFISRIKKYLDFILPNNWKVANVAMCSFVDASNKYRRMWVCDLQFDTSENKHVDLIPPYESQKEEIYKDAPLGKPLRKRKRASQKA